MLSSTGCSRRSSINAAEPKTFVPDRSQSVQTSQARPWGHHQCGEHPDGPGAAGVADQHRDRLLELLLGRGLFTGDPLVRPFFAQGAARGVAVEVTAPPVTRRDRPPLIRTTQQLTGGVGTPGRHHVGLRGGSHSGLVQPGQGLGLRWTPGPVRW
jgi:hypothetical protein